MKLLDIKLKFLPTFTKIFNLNCPNYKIESKKLLNFVIVDVELHPVFDTSFRLSRMHEQNKLTIEPPEIQSNCTKKAPEGANSKNGGNDEARTRDLMRDRHAL